MTESLATAEAAVRAGDPQGALVSLTAAVKANPSKPELRVFMAQLLCVLGQWERAHTQLNVVAELDAGTGPMREMVGHALRCELLRAAVFAGKRSPMVFGQPDEWLAQLIESLLQAGQGGQALSAELAQSAFDAAPATRGLINGEPFEWIADADSRLGPVLEAVINGRYYWVPFSRITKVSMEAPVDLRDLVWVPAHFDFDNGGESLALIPTRYPGSELSDDGAIALARKTAWEAISEDTFRGLGQRLIATVTGETPILDIRTISVRPQEQTAADTPDGTRA
jgi:type VI secretion system protein ImpE